MLPLGCLGLKMCISKMKILVLNGYFVVLAPHYTTANLYHTRVLCCPVVNVHGAILGIIILYSLLGGLALGCFVWPLETRKHNNEIKWP